MRHRKKSEKFNRSRAERKAFIRSMLRAVIISERIVTTESKAKGIRPWVDKLISWAKRGDLHAKRLSFQLLPDHALVKRLFDDIGPRFKDIPGGYTRVIDLGFRKGDGAKLAILELTKIEKKEKKLKEKKTVETKKDEIHEVKKEHFHDQKATDKPAKGVFAGVKKIFRREKDK
jgi:large subunit ribosomal protein L17